MNIYAINIALIFPAGIAATDSEDSNKLFLTQNGIGQYILPGTSIAGILRHKWSDYNKKDSKEENQNEDKVSIIFGNAAEEDTITDSPLYVPDAVLEIGKGEIKTHTYHRRNRHSGTVLDGGIFSIETTPPQTSTSFTLWLEEYCAETCSKFISWLASIFKTGIIFGGNSNRGVGLCKLIDIKIKQYDLDSVEKHMEYLTDRKTVNAGKDIVSVNNTNGFCSIESYDLQLDIFSVDLTLRIPRGQDFVISEKAQGFIKSVPMRITAADGNDYWRLPGSTLHGLFRDWSTHLAARDGKKIADSIDNYNLFKGTDNYTSDRISELFITQKTKEDDEKTKTKFVNQYPVANLFGSTLQAGRIHITDSFSKLTDSNQTIQRLAEQNICGKNSEIQKRDHIAINSISGGTFTGTLFSNAVIVNNSEKPPEWKVKVIILRPKLHEIIWLKKFLRALHIGLLRVGSSKGAGRLEVAVDSIYADKSLTSTFNENYCPNILEEK